MLKVMGALFAGLICLNFVILVGRTTHSRPAAPLAPRTAIVPAPVKTTDHARLQQLEVRVEAQQELIDYHQELIEQRQQNPCCETEETEGFVKSVTPF